MLEVQFRELQRALARGDVWRKDGLSKPRFLHTEGECVDEGDDFRG